VDAAESQLRRAQARLEQYEAVQGAALDVLAGSLVADGHPLSKPFEAFDAPTRSAIGRLGFAEQAKAVHQLVAAIQRTKTVGKATLQTAGTADKAARALEQALVPLAKLQDTIRDARRTRDAVGQGWTSALAALKRGARAALDEGAPDLYPTLFPPVTRAASKGKQAEGTAPEPKPPVEPKPSTEPTATAAQVEYWSAGRVPVTGRVRWRDGEVRGRDRPTRERAGTQRRRPSVRGRRRTRARCSRPSPHHR
jgi:hypothetical protein